MSHKSRRRSVAAGLGLAAGSALTAGFISVAAAPIALADGTALAHAPAPGDPAMPTNVGRMSIWSKMPSEQPGWIMSFQ